jgi:MraZ protein
MTSHKFDALFLGDFVHTLDSKNRLAIPSDWRKVFPSGTDDRLVVLRGATGCVETHVRPEWLVHVSERLRKLTLYGPQDMALRRMWLANAQEQVLDNQGRLVLPRRLVEFAGLRGEVKLIGQGPFFELWSPARLDRFVAEHSGNYDEYLRKLDGHGSSPTDADRRGSQDVPRTGTGE